MSAMLSVRQLLAFSLLTVCCSPALPADAPDPTLVAQGEYLARAADCVACHTAPGGSPMAGGLPIPTPLGTIYSTNITPAKTHGIGSYTFAQFARAVREGRRGDGSHLYPAMPYTSYALLVDQDVRALYAYFMLRVPPVERESRATSLGFPFGMRALMAPWNLLFLPRATFAADPAHDAQWNRGAYLVRGLEHCGACHTPRNMLMAEKASDELAGGAVGPWDAPNITSDAISGIGGWSVEELARYMKQGHAAGKGQAAGPMAEAVDNSLRFLTQEDLLAIAHFLQAVPPRGQRGQGRAAYAWGAAANDLVTLRGVSWNSTGHFSGPQLYDAYCATCHQASAQGTFDGNMPALFHNAAVGRDAANNLVLVILDGVRRDPDVFMPGFGQMLSDEQVATLSTYVRKRWGNPAAADVQPQTVARMRTGAADQLLLAIRAAMAIVAVAVLLVPGALLRRRKRRPHST